MEESKPLEEGSGEHDIHDVTYASDVRKIKKLCKKLSKEI